MSTVPTRIAVLEPGGVRAFGELLARPEIADHYFDCPRPQVRGRIERLEAWSGWNTDGILYLAAWGPSDQMVGGAHVTSSSIGFFVHPRWRLQGLAVRLVEACADLAGSLELSALDAVTRPTNLAAQRVLGRSGFVRQPAPRAGIDPERWHFHRDLKRPNRGGRAPADGCESRAVSAG